MGDRHQISIHALREEGDQKGHTERRRQAISIHALREEGDIPESYTELDGSVFLSTPSARRATYASRRHRQHRANFYPRPPRGGRPLATQLASCCCEFLSTPSARRATSRSSFRSRPAAYFYPRPPRGGRHNSTCPFLRPHNFYPRPPRGGRRERGTSQPAAAGYFYPRPPRGGRLSRPLSISSRKKFLSTPSARRATDGIQLSFQLIGISIHALREEGDTDTGLILCRVVTISIHALREEGDPVQQCAG